MNKRGSYGSMAERVARSRGEEPSPTAEPSPTVEPPPLKHCWVTTSAGRVPGLLLEWRKRPDGWHARVVRPVPQGEDWVVVEEWLPAGLLDPT